MVLYYSGTGNSKFIAKCIASALETDCLNLNERIKTGDTSSVQTEENVILVTPTYAWRIPHIVSGWLGKAELVGAKRIWFVMDCGSEIGNAAKYNRELAARQADNIEPLIKIHGHGPNRYAGELYRFVLSTGQAGSKSDCRERKARYPKHH